MKQYLEAGKIINTHGIRGEVKVDSWCDSPEALAEFETVYIDHKATTVQSARVHKNFVLMKLAGVETVEDAMLLKNKLIFIDRDDADLPEDTFFIQDVIGFDVFDRRQNKVIGKFREALFLPAGDIYRVEGEKGDILIPARPEFLKGTDMDNRVLTVETIPGMGDDAE